VPFRRHIAPAAAGLLLALLFAAGDRSARAQYVPSRGGYSDYYRSSYKRTANPRAAINPARYTVDRMYYHNPAISPYLNLTRPSSSYRPNYFTYVKPEENRRQRAAERQLQRSPGVVPSTGTVNRQGSAYQNHWYGSWKNRR